MWADTQRMKWKCRQGAKLQFVTLRKHVLNLNTRDAKCVTNYRRFTNVSPPWKVGGWTFAEGGLRIKSLHNLLHWLLPLRKGLLSPIAF